jgi:hypothetical protein
VRIVYTSHARTVIAERAIHESWIEAALASPDWVETDPADSSVERRFRAIPEMAGRILRVACSADAGEIRVITVFFDRRAKPKP